MRFKKSELSISQNQAVMKLIGKQNNDGRFLLITFYLLLGHFLLHFIRYMVCFRSIYALSTIY